MTIRIITNDRYAPDACIMSEDDFNRDCSELGFENYDFSDAGPEVETEQDIRDEMEGVSDSLIASLIEQFRSYQTT